MLWSQPFLQLAELTAPNRSWFNMTRSVWLFPGGECFEVQCQEDGPVIQSPHEPECRLLLRQLNVPGGAWSACDGGGSC